MKVALFLAFVFSTISVVGQIETSSILNCTINYTIPLSDLGQVYQKSPNYQIGFAKIKKYKKKQSYIGLNLGYLSMTSKYDTLIYEVITDNGLEYGKIHYKNYYSYQLLYTSQYDYHFNKFVAVFYGYDAGFHFNKYGHYLKDPFFTEESEDRIFRWVLSPKVGLKFPVNENVAITLQSQYLAAIGNASEAKMVFNQFFSVGFALIIKLN